MAISFNETMQDGKAKATINIDNGDLQALKDAMEQYGFVNQEALMRYALVSLLNSTDNKLYIKNDGNIVAMKISENLIKKQESQPEQKPE
jgi:hypothetical protein